MTGDPSWCLFYKSPPQRVDNRRQWYCFLLFLCISPSHLLLIFSNVLFPHFLHLLYSPSIHTSRPLPDVDRYSRILKKSLNNFESKIFSLFFSVTPLTFLLPPSILLALPLVQYQMEMMRSLRHVNIDHLHVGWYQSTYYGSFVSRALLDSQFSYQHAIEESVVLIYGK